MNVFQTPSPALLLTALANLALASPALAVLPRPDHVVVVMEENEKSAAIIGSSSAPYINTLANTGANFTNSSAITHPSQPNYLDIFSGSNQGMTDDTISKTQFTTANLGAEVRAKSLSFTGYSEGLPYAGYTDSSYTTSGQNEYMRKHNPWVNWQDISAQPPANSLPSSVNQPFGTFPSDFTLLPTVSFVVPNEQNDMHDGTIQQGDNWLHDNMKAYADWATTHNSLLVLTWDENDGSAGNQIATIMYGGVVKQGSYSESINHFNVLRTIEEMYGTGYAGSSASSTAITDAFVAPEPGSVAALGALLLPALLRRRRRS